MHAQPSTRSRKPAPLIVTCMSAGMLAVYCNALIDTNGEQCTRPEDCANAEPFTECSSQKVCVRPAAASGGDGAAGSAQTAADAASSSTGGGIAQQGTGGATTRGSGGSTASEPVDSGAVQGGGGGAGASYADAGPRAEAAAGSMANARGGGSAAAAGGAGPTEDASTGSTGRGGTTVTQSDGSLAGPPGPPASATHVLSFDTEAGWDVANWSGYRTPGERPPFDLAFGWKSMSMGASGVLTMWPEPDVADPNPRPVVAAIKDLDGSPVGKVPVGATVSCMVYIPSSCKFGTDGFLHMFVDGGEYAPDKFDWQGGEPCTARDRWETCTVEGTKMTMGIKIGFEFWYSADGDCMNQQVLVDWCAF